MQDKFTISTELAGLIVNEAQKSQIKSFFQAKLFLFFIKFSKISQDDSTAL